MLDIRFRRLWDDCRLPEPSAFDCNNDGHIEELACLLLERFQVAGDAEAFALLFQLTEARLSHIASRLLARHPRSVDSEQLLQALKRRLFLGSSGTPPSHLVGSFLALARSVMERELRSLPLRTDGPQAS